MREKVEMEKKIERREGESRDGERWRKKRREDRVEEGKRREDRETERRRSGLYVPQGGVQ